MKLLLLGDTHGSRTHQEYAQAQAKLFGCEAIVQLGDWGYTWPHDYPGNFNQFLRRMEFSWFFIDGNHDNFGWLKEEGLYLRDNPWREPVLVAPDLTYLPRGATWEWGSLRFMSMGGAISVDRNWIPRVLNRSWWLEESIGDRELEIALTRGPIDVLLSHDAPNNKVLLDYLGRNGFNLEPEILVECEEVRRKLTELTEALRPRFIFHGHYHHKYTGYINYGAFIVGLNCNEWPGDSFWVFDTEDPS